MNLFDRKSHETDAAYRQRLVDALRVTFTLAGRKEIQDRLDALDRAKTCDPYADAARRLQRDREERRREDDDNAFLNTVLDTTLTSIDTSSAFDSSPSSDTFSGGGGDFGGGGSDGGW